MRSYGSLALLVLLSCAGAAMAASQGDHDACAKSSGDETISACTRVIEDRGEDAGRRAAAYYNRGSAHLKGDADRAIADFSEAIRLDPKRADAYLNRALAYRIKNDVDRAMPDYNDTIRLDPKHPTAYIARGTAHNMKGDYDRAIADYNQAMQLGNKYTPVISAVRGDAYFAKKDFDRAIADYDAALKDNPKNAWTLFARGVAKKKTGNPGGDADIAAAKTIQADIAESAARRGIK